MFNPCFPCPSFHTLLVVFWDDTVCSEKLLMVAISYAAQQIAPALSLYADHQRLWLWCSRHCWESAQLLRRAGLKECGCICREVQSLEIAGKALGSSEVDGSMLLAFCSSGNRNKSLVNVFPHFRRRTLKYWYEICLYHQQSRWIVFLHLMPETLLGAIFDKPSKYCGARKWCRQIIFLCLFPVCKYNYDWK